MAFDGHRGQRLRAPTSSAPTDFGQTWKRVAGQPPRGRHAAASCASTRRTRRLLFAGTERGLFVSWDRGGALDGACAASCPTVPVDDIQIHPRDNDLIVATHGRGVWILDDLGAAGRRPTQATRDADLHLFDVGPAVRVPGLRAQGQHRPQGSWRPTRRRARSITYFLKAQAGREGRGEDHDHGRGGRGRARDQGPEGDGDQPGELGPARRAAGARPPASAGEVVLRTAARAARAARHLHGEGRRPAPTPPRGRSSSRRTRASRSATPSARNGSRRRARAAKLWGRAEAANRRSTALKKQLADVQESQKAAPDDVKAALKTLADTVDGLARQLNRQEPLGFAGAPLAEDPDPLLPRARALYLAISGITAAPTAQQRQSLVRVQKQVDETVAAVNAVLEKSVPEMNRMLGERGVGRIDGGKPIP